MLAHIDTEMLACYAELRALGSNGSKMFSPLYDYVSQSTDVKSKHIRTQALKLVSELQSINYDTDAFKNKKGWKLAQKKAEHVSRLLNVALFLPVLGPLKPMIDQVQKKTKAYVASNSNEVGDFIALLNSLGMILESGDYTGAGMEKFKNLKALGRILTGLKKE
jgi:hypothetical protein